MLLPFWHLLVSMAEYIHQRQSDSSIAENPSRLAQRDRDREGPGRRPPRRLGTQRHCDHCLHPRRDRKSAAARHRTQEADRREAIARHTAVLAGCVQTIRGHVFCSFLALVLKIELEQRIAALGESGSWPEILSDLDALAETTMDQDGKRFVLRSAPRPAATLALRAAGVALPPTVRQIAAN